MFFLVQYTEQEGRSLGLSGWVQNTRRGSVIGQIQGAAGKVDQMSVTLWYLLLLVITRLSSGNQAATSGDQAATTGNQTAIVVTRLY
ncbi:unnamed protein product [Arctogadus glacialis]